MNGRQRGRWALLACAVILASCGTDDLAPGPKMSSDVAAGAEAGGLDDALDAAVDAAAVDVLALDATQTAEDVELCGDCSELDSVIPADVPEDSSPDVDAGPACPGSTGCACATDSDCPAFGACMASSAGLVCVAPCVSGLPCAQGIACVPLPGAATDGSQDKTVCAPKFPTLCDPCTASSACQAPGSQAACVSAQGSAGASGWFCATPCASAGDCPSGYSCGSAALHESGEGQFCLPESATCTCSAAAIAAVLSTSCASAKTLPDGTVIAGCTGARACSAQGLSACSAPVSGPELCNGLDDDCNGVIDDGGNLCDDNNPCTADTCKGGLCSSDPIDKPCDDGSACTSGDVCKAGVCGGAPLGCDDGNPCTQDSCQPATGCAFQAQNGQACDDGNACTGGDACAAGVCKGGGDLCPCTTTKDCLAKEDGDLCNGTLYCAKIGGGTQCKVDPTTVVVCDPKSDTTCAVAQCAPQAGKCQPVAQNEGVACDDESACTIKDSCKLGVCGGSVLSCDDANACTDDSCDPAGGCLHKSSSGACDDGSACTSGDHCQAAACVSAAVSCDDGYGCTTDACDVKLGCTHAAVADAACGVVVPPYLQGFACGSGALDDWQLADFSAAAGTVRWGFDATPAAPGFLSPDCSLNVNNAVDLKCAPGQAKIAATADSPWIDATQLPAGSALVLRFASAGTWQAQKARVLVRASGGNFLELLAVASGADWQKATLALNAQVGQQFQLRFELAGPCGAAGETGWFVDDVAVVVDPCAKDNGGCLAGQICSLGDLGKATCTTCPSGYVGQGAACVDVDECKVAGTCDANATCTNSVGSFTCACKAGWQGDGKTCADIDECAAKTAGCAATATCVNVPGSAQCTCPKGQYGDGKTCVNKGGSKDFPALSCLEIVTSYAGSADGVYWLDIDAAGPSVAAQYLCDMKGGGWTLLMWDDFEDGATKGWSVGPVTTCGKFGHILGGNGVFGKNAATQKTVVAPPHTQARLGLDFLRIDSWLFEQGFVQVDGKTVWSKKGTGDLIFNGSKECGQGAVLDEKWGADWQGAHTAATLTLRATSDLDQNASNESFGIDNAVVWVK